MRFDLSRFDTSSDFDHSKYQVLSYPIHYKRKYGFSPTVRVSARYRKLVSEIEEMDRLLGDIHLSADDYVTALKDSYAINIRSSLISDDTGDRLSDVDDFIDAYHALDGKLVDSVGGPKQEIYNNIRAFAYGIGRGGDWDSDSLIRLHAMLMDGVDDRVIPGNLRTDKHAHLDGNGNPVSVSCPPEYIRKELDSLMDWLSGSPFDAICTGIMFVIELSGIYPFEYGGNRVSHTMFQTIVHDLGLKNIGFCRYDDLIDADREAYDRLFNYAKAEQDYFPVAMYLAEKVHESYRLALSELGPKDLLDGGDGYMVVIARYARSIEDEFTVSEACSWVPDVREQTVRTKLNSLVDLGILDRKGNTRNTRYRYNDLLRYLRSGCGMFG